MARQRLNRKTYSNTDKADKYEGFNTSYDPSWINRDHILVDGKKLSLKVASNGHYSNTAPGLTCRSFLINENVLFHKFEGKIDHAAWANAKEMLIQSTDNREHAPFYQVIDFSTVPSTPSFNETFWSDLSDLSQLSWIHSFLILSSLQVKSGFSNLQENVPHQLTNSSIMVKSVHQALRQIIKHTPQAESSKISQVDFIPLDSIDTYSKEELYQMVKQSKQGQKASNDFHKRRINQLYRMTTQITWEEPIIPKEVVDITPEDPYYLLFQASNVLQKEVTALISKSKELNSSLEQQVFARTQELAEKEINLSALLENTSEMFLSIDLEGRILVINKAFQEVFKEIYNKDLLPGDFAAELLPAEGLKYWEPLFVKAKNGEAINQVKSFTYRNQKTYYEYSLNPIHDDSNSITGVSFFCNDVTESFKAKEAVHRGQQMLESITLSVKEGIFRSNSKEGIIYVNKAFAEMFGYDTVEEVLALDPYVLYVNPSRRDDFVKMIQQTTSFNNEEVLYRRKDGSIFWGLISSNKAIDKNGNVYHDGAIRDVTQLKETERLLKEQNTELIKVNKELDKFVYRTSHDLRAPLASIQGLIDITRMVKTEEERQKYYGHMTASIDKLDGFINDIIEYSRNSRLKLAHEKIDFQELLSNAIEAIQYLPASEKVTQKIHVEGEGDFYSDPTRLGIIFNNMISNAVRYADFSKPESFLNIFVNVKDSKATVRIQDNGIGIEGKNIDKIFEMFYRATTKSKGSGIGLYIVHETVNRLGGQIKVDSTLGEGTTFTMVLPETPVIESE